MLLQAILEAEIFDLWGIDFMDTFLPAKANEYILMVVTKIFKWVEEI